MATCVPLVGVRGSVTVRVGENIVIDNAVESEAQEHPVRRIDGIEEKSILQIGSAPQRDPPHPAEKDSCCEHLEPKDLEVPTETS